MAAIAPDITNIQGRKEVEEVIPAIPIAFSGKQKLSQKPLRKPLVFNCVIWAPLVVREARKASGGRTKMVV